ncbi:hypothetical protein HYY74_04090 [Candidatus Woesearchaeota archaeon]|nr:hypothetical protein [Candidatus Woesearchaeota archaeon]
MKKFAVLACLLMIAAFASFAFAEEADISAETQAEASAAASVHGAQVRLLQLEKSIAKNIIKGKAVVEAAVKANASANTTGLEATLAEMEALKEQVSDERKELASGSFNSTAAVKAFVELKHDAIDLSKEFRADAKALVREQDTGKVREAANRERNTTEIKALNEQIRAEIRAYNAARLEEILKVIGAGNDTLVAKVKSGETNAGAVKAFVAASIMLLDSEDRKEAVAEIREEASKRSVLGKAVSAQVRARFEEEREERQKERIEHIEDEEIREIVRERSGAKAEARAEAEARGSGRGKVTLDTEVTIE